MGNILIFDDNKAVCEELRDIIAEKTAPGGTVIYTAVKQNEAREALCNDVSILFLDIQLENNESGIEFARYVNTAYPDIKIIFITAYIQYCEDIFSVRPDGFLVKPFSPEKVMRLLKKLENEKDKQDFLTVKNSKNQIMKIELAPVTHIESMNRKLLVYGNDGSVMLEFSDKLSHIEPELPGYFCRCHHSFMINLKFAGSIRRYSFALKNGASIPISQHKFKYAKEKFMTFLGEAL